MRFRDAEADPERPTWRAKVRNLPPLDTAPLRPSQITAIQGTEKSLAEQRFDRSLVQMATGAGKTHAAVTECCRLLKHGGFTRILFMVDRNNLGDQTLAEFQNYRTSDDGRRFTELCNIDKLTSAGMLGSSNVVISTIQREAACAKGVLHRHFTDFDALRYGATGERAAACHDHRADDRRLVVSTGGRPSSRPRRRL
jgi:type I site-specific restriction endonuclease